ncbi:MAG: hypothetical protein DLM69_03290, partial [Candidatus Chloroheliales bacterium]
YTPPPIYEQPRPVPPPVNPPYPMPERFVAPASAPEQITRVDVPETPRSPFADEASSLLERHSPPPSPAEERSVVEQSTLPPILQPSSYPSGSDIERETNTVESVSGTPTGQSETRTVESVSDTPSGQSETRTVESVSNTPAGETHTVESVSDTPAGETHTVESVSNTPASQERVVEQQTIAPPPWQSAQYEMGGNDAETKIVPPPERQI